MSARGSGNVGWNVGWRSRLECKAKRINGLGLEYGGEEIRRTARGRSKREAPPRPDRGAHPFWPGDRALHGTGSPLVAFQKKPLNLQNKWTCPESLQVETGSADHLRQEIWGMIFRMPLRARQEGAEWGEEARGRYRDLRQKRALSGLRNGLKTPTGVLRFFDEQDGACLRLSVELVFGEG